VSRIAIIAAMPGELKPLVKGWKSLPTGQRFVYKWTATFGDNECVAVCAGMGADAATRAFAQAEKDGPLDAVLSIGWVGALQNEGFPGEFFIPNIVVNAQTGERFTLAERDKPVVLVTTTHVANEAEKRRLAATYGGSVVDMESAAVARLAQMHGIPVCCMKITTDEVSARLPDLNPFIDRMGQMKMGRFIAHVLVRPKYWAALSRLGKASSAGADHIAGALPDLLARLTLQDFNELNRTGLIPDW
jgi:adenosylhomocysteine nucleosidase